MDSKKAALELIDQLTELEQIRDAEYVKLLAEKKVYRNGESVIAFHLKALKELVEQTSVLVPISSPMGCVSTKHCDSCQTTHYSSICVCALNICPNCQSSLPWFAPCGVDRSTYKKVKH